MIEIYYCTHDILEMRFDEEESPALWFNEREGNYSKIAIFHVESDPNIKGELDAIYRFLQNNGKTPWCEHPSIEFLGGFPRSMCKGDVLVYPELEIAYMCAHVGFVKL